jgi:hypothetical protein
LKQAVIELKLMLDDRIGGFRAPILSRAETRHEVGLGALPNGGLNPVGGPENLDMAKLRDVYIHSFIPVFSSRICRASLQDSHRTGTSGFMLDLFAMRQVYSSARKRKDLSSK